MSGGYIFFAKKRRFERWISIKLEWSKLISIEYRSIGRIFHFIEKKFGPVIIFYLCGRNLNLSLNPYLKYANFSQRTEQSLKWYH